MPMTEKGWTAVAELLSESGPLEELLDLLDEEIEDAQSADCNVEVSRYVLSAKVERVRKLLSKARG